MIIVRLPLHHPLTQFALAGTLAANLTGCAPNLAGSLTGTNQTPTTGSQTGNGTQTAAARITTTVSNGVSTSIIDADAAKTGSWTYLSLGTGSEVSPASPEASTDWDLAFQGTTIKANGGVSGSGNVSVARLEGVDFDALTTAPAAGYVADAADSDDTGNVPDTGFLVNGGWYSYDATTHVVTPKQVVYVIRTTAGKFYKVRITDYYDAAKTPRVVTLRWAEVAAPFTTKSVSAPSSGQTYLNLRTGQVVTPTDPLTSSDWDLALSGTRIRTNSGTSGGQQGGAIVSTATSLLELASVPAGTVAVDETLDYAGQTGTVQVSGNPALKAWYDYNSATHVVTPKNLIYVVRTADGRFAKLKIRSYQSSTYELEWCVATGTSTTF